MPEFDEALIKELADFAWESRSKARVYGATAVGCAVLDEEGNIFGGCNIEHRYRSHDIHAEINAISSLVAGGGGRIRALFIVAEREQFTPCGSCMDWIFEVGAPSTVVLTQRERGGGVMTFTAEQLMPHYPR